MSNNFDIDPQGPVCLQAKYLLPCCCMRHSLYFDMQHGNIPKKLKFGLSPLRGSDPFFLKVDFERISSQQNSMNNYPTCKWLMLVSAFTVDK